jgi:hypothetical protein
MSKDHTTVTHWSVKDLVDAINDRSTKRTVSLPRFQRNVVWQEDKRKDFIKSLKNGFPFGALLLAGTKAEGDKFQLIDGLQRTNTILDYYKKRTAFVSDDEVRKRSDITQEIARILSLPETQIDALIQVIVGWINGCQDFDPLYDYQDYYLARKILDSFGRRDDSGALHSLIKVLTPFTVELKEEANIENIQIPIVIYTGPEEDLATIFEKLNSQGTRLNKYQIFAAAWNREEYQIHIQRSEIADLIRTRYKAWVDAGLQVNDYDENMSDKEFRQGKFTIFEYLFGLSRLLATGEHRRLFNLPDDEADTDPISFVLCTVCLGIKLNDMKEELPKKLLSKLRLGQENFENALFDAIDFVDQALDRFIGPEFNIKKSRGRRKISIRRYHNDYQIIALISTVFRAKYDDELKVRPSWANVGKDLQNNIPYHYLYDILRNYWVGVKDFKDLDYSRKLSRDAWDSLLDQWFENNQLRRRETERVRMRDADYLFLNYIYTYTFWHGEVLSPQEFELEHIVPVGLLQGLIEKSKGQGLPISAVSNFGLLNKEFNTQKKDTTIYEYYDKQIKKLTDADQIKELQSQINDAERFLFITREQLNFIDDKLSAENYERLYIQFLRNRFKVLKEAFYEKNSVRSLS